MITRDIVFVVNFFYIYQLNFCAISFPLQHFVSEIPKFSKFIQKKGK